uniref:Uncharacterized protein n=1 Tax=Arundo donax TaxID=35708 RepID=A0A0A9AHY8_ARUDO
MALNIHVDPRHLTQKNYSKECTQCGFDVQRKITMF